MDGPAHNLRILWVDDDKVASSNGSHVIVNTNCYPHLVHDNHLQDYAGKAPLRKC